MKALEYLDAIKAEHKIDTDYKLAKLMKVSPQKVSNWRAGRDLPGPLACFKIAELLKDQPSAVIADIELERAQKGEREADADAWRDLIGKIGGGGVAALVLALGLGTSSPADATTQKSFSEPSSVYYVKSKKRREAGIHAVRIQAAAWCCSPARSLCFSRPSFRTNHSCRYCLGHD